MRDYKQIGLKVGLEIHRQLDFNKLFCNCPSILRENDPDLKIKRKLRAVVSETGKKDIVAEFEEGKGREAIYEYYSDCNCLVELDEEPCHEMNKDALKAALEASMIVNAKISDEIQVMRKQVLNYSNTSGFQRTALISRNGNVEVKGKKIGIQTICLEEDAAREIRKDEKTVTYRLDRLGIPLIEIATAPDMNDPEQVKDVAEYIGMILKSVGAKSGLGTVRQDLNVNIKGHPRVEIKGVQNLRDIPKIIENEVKRQLEVKNGNSEVRMVKEDLTTEFLRPMPGASRMYVETDVPNIKVSLENIKKPELIIEKSLKIEELGISSELAKELIKNKIEVSKYVDKFSNIEPGFIAHVLIEIPKELKSRFNVESKFSENDFIEVLDYLNKGKIIKKAVLEILLEKAKGNKIDYSKYGQVSDKEVEEFIRSVFKKELSDNAIIGIVMGKYKGKVDGKKVIDIINKLR